MEENRRKKQGLLSLPVHIDITTVIFFTILVYILFSIALYATSKKTEVYEVRMGRLTESIRCRGIALREESLVSSRYTGTINYYNCEGDRVRAGGLAYSVDETAAIEDYADSDMRAGAYFSEKDLRKFRERSIQFSSDFDPSRFYTAYDFKSTASSEAQKISNRTILSGIEKKKPESLHTVNAKRSGSIVYSYDNYVGKDFDSLTPEDFDISACKKTQLENGKNIIEGKPAYKIVTDENWSVAILADSTSTAKLLIDSQYVEVRFLKNGQTCWALVEGREIGNDQWILNLCFSNAMEEFCMDRFIDLEVLPDEAMGLKVPASSITAGDFFLVPKEFVFRGSNNQMGVLTQVYKEGDSIGSRFIPAVPYSETDKEYYLDDSVLKTGMVLERPNSIEQFTLGKKEKLSGVYYINKGYPDFRQVRIERENSDYCIVKTDSLYGLQEYDYVVLHADSIHFNNY